MPFVRHRENSVKIRRNIQLNLELILCMIFDPNKEVSQYAPDAQSLLSKNRDKTQKGYKGIFDSNSRSISASAYSYIIPIRFKFHNL